MDDIFTYLLTPDCLYDFGKYVLRIVPKWIDSTSKSQLLYRRRDHNSFVVRVVN